MELKHAVENYLASLGPKDSVWDNPHLAVLVLMTTPNKGHTGARQPILQPTTPAPSASFPESDPSPQVPAAAVAPLVENITDKYADLKRTVHDYLVTLPPEDPCWKNSFLPTLAEQVGLTKP
jgi:hypothetical protein